MELCINCYRFCCTIVTEVAAPLLLFLLQEYLPHLLHYYLPIAISCNSIIAPSLLVVGDHDVVQVERTVENKGDKLPEIEAALMPGFLDGTSAQARESSNELLNKLLSA